MKTHLMSCLLTLVLALPLVSAPVDDDVALLEELIRLPSVSADIPAVNRTVDFLRERLAADGLFCRVETMTDGRRVLFAANVESTHPDVLLSAHLDVVPAQTPELFVPRRDATHVYGRGASDCKEHCVLARRIMRALKGRVSVGCIFGSDEEIGGASTAFMLAREYAARRLVVVFDSEQFAITTRQKGLADYVFDRTAEPVHAGFVKGPVPHAALDLLTGFQNLCKSVPMQDDGSFCDVVTLRTISGDREKATMTVRYKCAATGDWARVERLLSETIGGTMTCTRRGDAVILDESAPYLQEFRARMRRRWPDRNVDFYHLDASTDARHLQHLGVPMLILGVDARGAHTPQERVCIASLDDYADLMIEYLTTISR